MYNFVEFKYTDICPRVFLNDSRVMPCDSVQQLKNSSEILGNFAKKNDVDIVFFDPRHIEKLQSRVPDSDLAACVGMSIHQKGAKETKYGVVDYFKGTKNDFIKRVVDEMQKVVSSPVIKQITPPKETFAQKLKLKRVVA